MDEMGAALAHELNQPLTAVMLYLQAIKRAHDSDPGRGILSETARGDLRQGAAGSGARRQYHPAHALLRRKARAQAPMPRPQSAGRRRGGIDAAWAACPAHEIARALAPDLPRVAVDPVQIQQIVVNLLRNALDAVSVRRGHRRFRCRRGVEATPVEVTVADNGPGISPETLPNLFKAFSSSKGNGLGLGLAISRTIAQTHGGDLTVDPGGARPRGLLHASPPAPSDGPRRDGDVQSRKNGGDEDVSGAATTRSSSSTMIRRCVTRCRSCSRWKVIT